VSNQSRQTEVARFGSGSAHQIHCHKWREAKMALDTYAVPISELHESTTAMLHNLTFIQKELPTLELVDDLTNEIVAVCQRFEWTLRDIRKEIYILEDKLGMHPGKEPFDPAVVNADPKATMSLIERWVTEETQAMDTLVKKLWTLSGQDKGLGTVSVLVTESAANILNARARVKEALSSISAQLE
jgi:hypothetical protein